MTTTLGQLAFLLVVFAHAAHFQRQRHRWRKARQSAIAARQYTASLDPEDFPF